MLNSRKLILEQLSVGCPGLTPEKGATFAQAAAVCLEYNDHPLETDMAVGGTYSDTVKIVRIDVDDQMRRSNGDLQYATEDGAYGVAILAAKVYTGLTVVERKSKVGGFDWYLGTEPENEFSLINKAARLEVSGILRGDDATIAARVRQKLRQMNPSDESGLPGYAVVVEFGRPESRVVRK